MNYDSKYYEFATTSHTIPGKVEPPAGERWTFVQMSLSERIPAQVILLWVRQKKG